MKAPRKDCPAGVGGIVQPTGRSVVLQYAPRDQQVTQCKTEPAAEPLTVHCTPGFPVTEVSSAQPQTHGAANT